MCAVKIEILKELVPYAKGLEIQASYVQQLLTLRSSASAAPGIIHRLLVLEHEPVFTLGRRESFPTDPGFLNRLQQRNPQTPVIKASTRFIEKCEFH